MRNILLCRMISFVLLLLAFNMLLAQNSLKLKYKNSTVYTGIEVGSKGVKMSLVEVGKNARSSGAFNILKDTSVNTDFISFNENTFSATLNALCGLYNTAEKDYDISDKKIFTAVSSGVKMQAEKDQKNEWITMLVDSFRTRIKEPKKEVAVIDARMEAWLSHLGIVPEARRYSTFLIDIGSGNTKGGYFPKGNTNKEDFYLFELNWGTKSTANAAEKRLDEDKSLSNYKRQLTRVLASAENPEIIYAVNSSGAYPLSDYIAFSGGIAWATANLLHPEMSESGVVPVTFDEVVKFTEKLYTDPAAFSETNLSKMVSDPDEQALVFKTVKTIHGVFDQKSLMAGAGLLMKIMRQFSSIYETKQFYLVKNGQVGWISAYVDQVISNK